MVDDKGAGRYVGSVAPVGGGGMVNWRARGRRVNEW